jgi:hypothetical protein
LVADKSIEPSPAIDLLDTDRRHQNVSQSLQDKMGATDENIVIKVNGGGGDGAGGTAGGIENHVALIVSVMAAIVAVAVIIRLINDRLWKNRHGAGGRYHSPWKKDGRRARWAQPQRSVSDQDFDDEDEDGLEMTGMADMDFGL